MTSTVDIRNNRARTFVSNQIAAARAAPIIEDMEERYADEMELLRRFIPVSQKGFRGVVLTSIVGAEIDNDFNPLTDFYACHPRSIFENGIYYALQEHRIPCGKSDPLNVAKNIQKLDSDWAIGKRPETAAKAAVAYLKLYFNSSTTSRQRTILAKLFFLVLTAYADSEQNIPVETPTIDEQLPIEFAEKLAKFAVQCPESGTVPQFIVGILLEALRNKDARYLEVGGVNESVFGTNTTSNKPADLWEVLSTKEYGNLYEVTVKPIDRKRLDDCAENLQRLGIQDNPVTFVCRLPADLKKLESNESSIVHRGVRFQFLDIAHLIITVFCSLTVEDQAEIANRLKVFLTDTNRQRKTKEYWNELVAIRPE